MDNNKLFNLFNLFKGNMNILVSKLIEHNAFNDVFLKNINNNLYLNSNIFTKNNINKYNNIEILNSELNKYFRRTNIENIDIYKSTNDIDILTVQLNNAVNSKNYNLADKINKYIINNKRKIIFF